MELIRGNTARCLKVTIYVDDWVGLRDLIGYFVGSILVLDCRRALRETLVDRDKVMLGTRALQNRQQ